MEYYGPNINKIKSTILYLIFKDLLDNNKYKIIEYINNNLFKII